MILSIDRAETLLGPDEPNPVHIHRPGSRARLVFLCEHACNRMPASLDMLGLPQSEIHRHIGWDIGALDVATALADRFDASLFFQEYSRLVIDCNRPLDSAGLIPKISESTSIPGNICLSLANREKRITEIWQPYQQAIAEFLSKKTGRPTLVVSIHSFTPVFKGEKRPWEIGLLFNRHSGTAQALRSILHSIDPTLNIGMNQPYSISDENDYTVPVFGELTGLPHVLIEIRQDLICEKILCEKWIRLFEKAFRDLEKSIFKEKPQ